jgi:beta-mannosidase
VDGHPGSREVVDLSGTWLAQESQPDLVKDFAEPALADATWINVHVPGHWRNEPAFAASDGPLLYRRHFTAPAPAAGQRAFLDLEGISYYGDVWLDGDYLGATEGSFFGHAFEVTEALRSGGEHLLAIEVASPPQRDHGAQRTISGPYWNSPLLDAALNPGGLWQPVRIVECGPVRLEAARVRCVEASVERGRLACDLTLDAGAEPRETLLHATVRGPDGDVLLEALREVSLAAGTNALSWMLAVEAPPRWWPHTRGAQALCTLDLRVECNGSVSDSKTFRTAFREVRRHGAHYSVNGEQLYLKGASYGPARALLADADDALVRGDVDRAIAANLDFLRVHTHIASAALYDAADERGLLLWQDMPMHGGFARGVRKQATRQARALVDRLAHHPSVFVWCAHDAPLGDNTPARVFATATAPTWGKEVLDRSVARALTRHDGTRPVIRHSGSGDNAHAWFGWLHGDIDDLASAIRVVPRLGAFLSAFGAQAVPENAEWMHPEAWPELDWDALAEHHGVQLDAISRHVPPADAKSFAEWREATQAYQAALLQLQIEDLRRCKGAPSGGFAMYAFVDPGPVVGHGVLDAERVPKRAYASLTDACRPVLPMIDPRTGNVHVVNDTPTELAGAEIEVATDGRVRRWTGDVSPDAIAFIATVDIGDAVDVEVVLTHPDTGRVVNRYPLVLLEAGRR